MIGHPLRRVAAGAGAALAVLLAGCGAVAQGGRYGSAPTASSTSAPRSTPDPTMSSVATSAPRPPAPTAHPQTAPPTMAPMAQPQPAAMTFLIRPLAAPGARGTVTVTADGASDRYHVVVTGLQPGSTHTVHDHLGTCAAANRSRHLMVLTRARADGAGVIVFDATVPGFDAGPDRVVIVYSTASPNLIIGCADL